MNGAIVKLAADPPKEVGRVQTLTSKKLLRPFPLGLRFSGKNMSPLPCWLGGAQNICLNFSDNDLAVQLHFALFNGSDGFVVKPLEMLQRSKQEAEEQDHQSMTHSLRPSMTPSLRSSERSSISVAIQDDDDYWPPHRDKLYYTSIEILSLHHCPKRSERRPRLNGSRADVHKYHPELSGASAAPDNLEPSSPALLLSLHPIGGFCGLSEVMPLQRNVEAEVKLKTSKDNGLNAQFAKKVHCVAAEPHACFLRVGVIDGGREVAYETCVLARLRPGYGVLQLRGVLGTRIELCFLFVRIAEGRDLMNRWPTVRQLRVQNLKRLSNLNNANLEIDELKQKLRTKSERSS